MEYKYTGEQRERIQDKVAKLQRENDFGSTLSSQVEANKHMIKQLQYYLDEKKPNENHVPFGLTHEEKQEHEKHEKVSEELHRIQCIKAHIECLKQEMARQEYMLAKAEVNMCENGLGHLV